ncbi:MAG: polyphosphate kinase 1 [Clostridia bacterium]|nr:polyphosphate kinase 1 [Clostridia bacterium]
MPAGLLTKQLFTQNRELSWLKFNDRVLQEAMCDEVPLYEKLKFISIFTSNLDEFFMIRVGGLFDLSIANECNIDNKTGMTPKEQLQEIYRAVSPLYRKKDMLFFEVISKLRENSIFHLTIKDLTADELKYIKEYFKSYILPIISPLIVDELHPFPFVANKQIHIAAQLQSKKKTVLGLIPMPSTLPSVIFLPGDDIRYIQTAEIIYEYAEAIFETYEVKDKRLFCVTRNADINPDDEAFDENEDFRNKMKQLIKKRKRLAVVRLETDHILGDWLQDTLSGKFSIKPEQIFVSRSPFSLEYVFALAGRLTDEQKKRLCYKPFSPQLVLGDGNDSGKKDDMLLFYPYESMKPFLDILRKAANDDSVLSIKITIYRLSKNAKLIEYLCQAAENGKEVIVLIELRARFDEQNNIDWSERLEQAGCTIIYGFDEFKVHSKICLITKRERGKLKYITQIGTGNYNEETAKLYTDLSLITENQEIGADAAAFFKNMAMSNLGGVYRHLWVAPNSLKTQLINLIKEEMEKGEDGRIVMKVNSVTDIDVINQLKAASCAGVKITLLVRGICCLLPGVPDFTENITVISIVGRFLEHSRIYSFGTGENQRLFISSADIMTRNMQKRVEVACPIFSEAVKAKINHIIEVMLYDTIKARELKADGTYERIKNASGKINSQEIFIEEAMKNAKVQASGKKNFVYKMFKKTIDRLYEKLNSNG